MRELRAVGVPAVARAGVPIKAGAVRPPNGAMALCRPWPASRAQTRHPSTFHTLLRRPIGRDGFISKMLPFALLVWQVVVHACASSAKRLPAGIL